MCDTACELKAKACFCNMFLFTTRTAYSTNQPSFHVSENLLARFKPGNNLKLVLFHHM